MCCTERICAVLRRYVLYGEDMFCTETICALLGRYVLY